MIDHHRKFIFLHIPKCGGTSIEKVILSHYNINNDWTKEYPLEELPMKVRAEFNIGFNHQHFLLNEILNEYPKCLNYFKFAFIRNPFSRIVSEYNYILSYSKNLENLSFRDFILNLENYLNIFAYVYHDLSLCDYLLNKEGELVVDFVGRLENFQEDFNEVCSNLEMPNLLLPHTNVSKKSRHNASKKNYTEYYDNETREIVARKFAKDIEYSGYEFGE